MLRPLRLLPVLALALLAGCGGGSDSPTVAAGTGAGPGTGSSGGASTAPLADLLPQRIRDAGVVRVGSDIAYAPVEFYAADGTTATGIDPDLAKALGEQLGVRFMFANSTFDGLITQLRSGRIDTIMSAMSDTPEREKQVDFVDYFDAGTSILVKKGNPQNISSLSDLCGKTVALERGTTQEQVATTQKGRCQAAGKPLTVLAFDRDTEALLQVKQGRAAADLNDFPVAAYNAKTSGGGNDFQVVGSQIQAGPYGIAFRKQDTQLRDAVKQALQKLLDNGQYKAILDRWNVAQGAVSSVTVNGGK